MVPASEAVIVESSSAGWYSSLGQSHDWKVPDMSPLDYCSLKQLMVYLLKNPKSHRSSKRGRSNSKHVILEHSELMWPNGNPAYGGRKTLLPPLSGPFWRWNDVPAPGDASGALGASWRGRGKPTSDFQVPSVKMYGTRAWMKEPVAEM